MATGFLSAGFSTLGGILLASQLFEKRPIADVNLSEDLIKRVRTLLLRCFEAGSRCAQRAGGLLRLAPKHIFPEILPARL